MEKIDEKFLCVVCGNTVMLMEKGTEPLSCCGEKMISSSRIGRVF
ncbi:MAG: hypothetical protein KAS16_00845 [Thermoplasmata archaeon]|nr:hypothetical protein [Thermoplasmata archaeon]